MEIGEELYYSKDHDWVKIDGDKAYIGITDYTQNALEDIEFIELPFEEDKFEEGEAIGVIESVKAVFNLYIPVSGEVIEINEKLQDNPEKINKAPYDSWMVAVELTDKGELDDLMTAEEYEEFCKEEIENLRK
ncbi:glycine cleavage system protein GcvH [Sporohalobacter salinus]|uniref:glycine cleavage system protein GcvH n=1 Tax=Sporohalobacter salinus TaxID=1494606 RepID=UPI001962129A|nr:glycine cleavage system protein GcvH [Sporohalobacter salinus]MBM7624429.1 glycine cleavage system H protein [Sporohalobacter salinus]